VQDVKPVEARHFEIQKHQIGQGVFNSVCIVAESVQIIDGFFTIPDYLEPVDDLTIVEGFAGEQNVIRLIFCEQNDGWITHGER